MSDQTTDPLGTQPTIPLTAANRPAEALPLPRPRIRFGAIVWGLLLCTSAAVTLWIATDTARRQRFGDWLIGLTPGTAGILAILIAGGLLLLWGSLAAVRRSQERRAPRL